MKISCDCKDTLALDEITEFQGGLKDRSPEEIGKIIKSLKKYGFAFPLFVWKDGGMNWCLDGHGRLLALKKMREDGEKIPPLPVVYVKAKDEEEARNLLLRLNSQYGRMTADSVREFAEGFDVDFSELQLPCGMIDFDVAGVQDDEVPDVDEKEEPDSQPGEMYELGSSILMCGDSTDQDAVARLMGGEKADMVFTDPPYNVGIGSKNKALNDEFRKNHRPLKGGRCEDELENDKGMTDEEVGEKLWKPAFVNMRDNSKDCCAIYVTMPQGGTHMMMMMMMSTAWQVKHELIWVKNQPTFSMGRLNYDYQHEPICYGWNKSHKWIGKGKFTKSIWNIDKPKSSKEHPTMKPVELVENALPCEKNNRKARLMELSPRYCDLIRRRYTKWAKENGKPITSGCLE